MRLIAKRVKDGFLIPIIEGLEDKSEIEVEIIEEIKLNKLSDSYIWRHWRELIMTRVDSSDYYKSERYYIERALSEKRDG
ncbi:MAG: hypothetical protein N2042_02545 [Thermodesulfovibrio sp.]|nr:hypothetical protein [Thermodesulfovibrio sp.]